MIWDTKKAHLSTSYNVPWLSGGQSKCQEDGPNAETLTRWKSFVGTVAEACTGLTRMILLQRDPKPSLHCTFYADRPAANATGQDATIAQQLSLVLCGLLCPSLS